MTKEGILSYDYEPFSLRKVFHKKWKTRVHFDVDAWCIITVCGATTTTTLLNQISIGNRMNASALRDIWARVMF